MQLPCVYLDEAIDTIEKIFKYLVKRLRKKINERIEKAIKKAYMCPKCRNGTQRLNTIGGYADNPWGYWTKCDNWDCGYEVYYDNPKYDKSRARYSEDGELLG